MSEQPKTLPCPPAEFTLSEATLTLFFVAARSHNLAEQFGVELIDDGERLRFLPGARRPFLVAHPVRKTELTFDADLYARTLDQCSTYTAHMRRWILNVWNPAYAREKGWTFDLFTAMRGLDSGNLNAIAWHLQHPIFP